MQRTWTTHENALLQWLRLRPTLAECLGLPEPLRLHPNDIEKGPERPPELAACSSHCLVRAAPLFEAQGLLAPWHGTWRLPAPHATAIDACWKLIPAFHGRWGNLWDLRSLEEALPMRFEAAQAIAALQARSAACHGSRLHHGTHRDAENHAERFRALCAEGWLNSGGPLSLTPTARDALMLFRLVTGPRVALPPDRPLRRLPSGRSPF